MADTSNAFTKTKISALTFIDTLLSSQRTRTHHGHRVNGNVRGLHARTPDMADNLCLVWVVQDVLRTTSLSRFVKTGSVSVSL